eukprot:PhM_4_TR15094/c0_g1_i1/m.71818
MLRQPRLVKERVVPTTTTTPKPRLCRAKLLQRRKVMMRSRQRTPQLQRATRLKARKSLLLCPKLKARTRIKNREATPLSCSRGIRPLAMVARRRASKSDPLSSPRPSRILSRRLSAKSHQSSHQRLPTFQVMTTPAPMTASSCRRLELTMQKKARPPSNWPPLKRRPSNELGRRKPRTPHPLPQMLTMTGTRPGTPKIRPRTPPPLMCLLSPMLTTNPKAPMMPPPLLRATTIPPPSTLTSRPSPRPATPASVAPTWTSPTGTPRTSRRRRKPCVRRNVSSSRPQRPVTLRRSLPTNSTGCRVPNPSRRSPRRPTSSPRTPPLGKSPILTLTTKPHLWTTASTTMTKRTTSMLHRRSLTSTSTPPMPTRRNLNLRRRRKTVSISAPEMRPLPLAKKRPDSTLVETRPQLQRTTPQQNRTLSSSLVTKRSRPPASMASLPLATTTTTVVSISAVGMLMPLTSTSTPVTTPTLITTTATSPQDSTLSPRASMTPHQLTPTTMPILPISPVLTLVVAVAVVVKTTASAISFPLASVTSPQPTESPRPRQPRPQRQTTIPSVTSAPAA